MTGRHLYSARPLFGWATVVVVAVSLLLSATAAGAHAPGKNPKMRRHIVARTRNQLGTRYLWGGASPSGFDCSGLTRWVYAGHGASLPHRAALHFQMAGENGFRSIYKRKKLKRGDLVFFKTTSAYVGHVGIYVGHDVFIGTSSVRGRVVRNRLSTYGALFRGATRVPRLTG